MAFVFKSPRNLDSPLKDLSDFNNHASGEVLMRQESLTKNKVQKASPIKKLPCTINQKLKQSLSSGKQIQQFFELPAEASQKSTKKKLISNHEQYFFKSKCERNFFVEPAQKICIAEKSISPSQKNSKDLIEKKNPFLINKQKCEESKIMSLAKAKRKLDTVDITPSIPGKVEKFGYVLEENNLKYPKFVLRQRFEGNKEDCPGPFEYETIKNSSPRGVIKFGSVHRGKETQLDQNSFYALVNDKEALKMHNAKIRQWIDESRTKKRCTKKVITKEKKREISTRDSTSSDSGVTVYDDDTTPGPGYYQYDTNKKANFRSKNAKVRKIFINQSQRFPKEAAAEQNENTSFQNQPKSKKQTKFFMSRLSRALLFQDCPDTPSPGYYDVRGSLENDIINKILRNSPYLYNNNIPRLANNQSSNTPGPGYYEAVLPNFKVENNSPQSFSSQNQSKIRNEQNQFQKCEMDLIERKSKQKKHKRIHERQDYVVEPQNYAPFMSTSKRVLSNVSDTYNQKYSLQSTFLYSSPKKIENNYPFNSSQEKGQDNRTDYKAVVGLYDLTNINEWNKKSFNVSFN